jgi:oligopeptidase B
MKPPVAKKIPHTISLHNDHREDQYYWLNDRENAEVIAYLEAENAYTKEVLKDTETFQEELFQEIKGRIKQTDESVPYKKKGYWFYNRFVEGKEYGIYCRKKGSMEAEEEVLLDVNLLAEGKSFCQVGGLSISPDHNLLIYGVDFVGRRQFDLYLKDLQSGEIRALNIENTAGGATWANDGLYFFYTAKDPVTLRTDKIYRSHIHTLEAVLVFHETDETFYTHIGKSKSEKFLIIGSGSTLTSEMQYLSADDPLGSFTIFQPRIRGHEYNAAHFQDRWYVVTNHEAKNFRLMECPLEKTGMENWNELVAHREDTLLEGLELFEHFIVLEERTLGLTQLRIRDQRTGHEHYLNFGEETYSAGTGTNPEYETEILRFGYTSMTTPGSVYDYHMVTREKTLMKQQVVVGGYNPDEYQAERRWAKSSDGTLVPMSIVYRKDQKRASAEGNPLLLYGYGSYGHSMDAYFSATRLSLLDRGFVFVLAHIRGGEDLGRKWYEEGRLMNKKNTFLDFIACAEFLLNEQYTSTKHLFAMGGSAGGLLMGAVVNMRPELWKGIVAQVPFVDVVTTMMDDSIPLTTGEFDEWGNPSEEEYYHYIKSYSPYDNIESKAYPNMLITTGLHDSQVQYWEPAKWVARLRDRKTDQNLLLLQTNMDAGHGGASGRFEQYRETALEYAFMLMLVEELKGTRG